MSDQESQDEKKRTEAPHLGKFDNPFTLFVLLLVIGLILGGIWKIYNGNILSMDIVWSLIITGLGATIWVTGLTEHSPAKPRQAGLLTFWGTPIRIPWVKKWEDSIVVGGKVILLPFPPFEFSSVKVDIDNSDEVFTFTILTSDSVPMEVKVSITAHPDTGDLPDYIQAGGDMKNIFKQSREIIYRETQREVTLANNGVGMKAEEIQRSGEKLSAVLEKNVNKFFETKSFGVKVIKVQIEASLPQKLRDKIATIKEEDYDRQAERKEYETMRMAARDMQLESARQFVPEIIELSPRQQDESMKPLIERKLVKTLDEYVNVIKDLRLVRDEKYFKIDSGDGKGRTIPVAPFDIQGKGGK